MAIDILTMEGVSHEFFHSLESILYILCWICVTRTGPGDKDATSRKDDKCFQLKTSKIAKWVEKRKSLFVLSALKKGTVACDNDFEAYILSEFSEYFEPLKLLAANLRDLLLPHWPAREDRQRYEEWKDFPAGTHQADEARRFERVYLPIKERSSSEVFSSIRKALEESLERLPEEQPYGRSPAR